MTTADLVSQRLKFREELGEERALKLMELLDKFPCPFCGSHKLDLEGQIMKDGVVLGGEILFVGDFSFRVNCKDCGAQYVPSGVIECGGFGII